MNYRNNYPMQPDPIIPEPKQPVEPDIERLAAIFAREGYEHTDVIQACTISDKAARLHFLLKKSNCDMVSAQKALRLKDIKIQLFDRLLSVLAGSEDNLLPNREDRVKMAKRIVNWLTSNRIVDLSFLIAEGPYYPSQPESKEVFNDGC